MVGVANTEHADKAAFEEAATMVRDRVKAVLVESFDEVCDAMDRDSGMTMMALVAASLGAGLAVAAAFNLPPEHDAALADWAADFVRTDMPRYRHDREVQRAGGEGPA